MRQLSWFLIIPVACAVAASPGASAADRAWTVHHGQTVLSLDNTVLQPFGVKVRSGSDADASDGPTRVQLDASPDLSPLTLGAADGAAESQGEIHHAEGLIFSGLTGEWTIEDLVVGLDPAASTTSSGELPRLIVAVNNVVFDPVERVLVLEAEELRVSPALAESLGSPELADAVIGSLVTRVWLATESAGEPSSPSPSQTDGGTPCGGSPGPDVIVGDMTITNYTPVGGIDAFAVGTTSCNQGQANLLWVASSVNHPVIPQNMYRYKVVNGASRFEQIGQSWMKHAFTALTQSLCCSCNGQGGSVLGVGCSDPYTAGRNGTQITTTGGLGPRFEVNAHAGAITWPYTFRGIAHITHTTTTRRLQVHVEDLDSTMNPGAVYYAEAQYVTPDDASARNQNNNASHRRISISGGPTDFSASMSTGIGTTQREDPAIRAWPVHDPTVTLTNVDTPEAANGGGDTTGYVIVGADATDLGGGVHRYEYAVYNMNSDRSISSFSVPVSPTANVTNIAFHDVDYHSGDGFNSAVGNVVTFDGTDWPGVKDGGVVRWNMVPATPLGNSNAIRWGTQYNFRFDCDAPPTTGDATLGMFKPVAGRPDSVAASTVVPQSGVTCIRGDVNGDKLVNGGDTQRFIDVMLLGGATPREICAGDLEPVPDGQIDPDDIAPYVNCLLAGGCP